MNYERTQRQDGEQRGSAQRLSQKHDRPPTDVPGYDIKHFLGAGAYGEVWTAIDIKTGRKVAIKFYSHRGGLDWSLLSREVEKLCFLFTDRYIVQLLDVGWDSEPPYYVMEYMEPGALEDHLRDGPLPVDQALTLFREVAIGLLHAHGKGVLHCDLKPANVLLDQDGKPRLADFGQSRLSHEQTPALGTLFYMAPEQASLEAVPNAAWDVYALGALFYCMLTGAPPHRTSDSDTLLEEAISLEERLDRYRKIIEQAPAPREHRRISGMDRHLADILDRCLDSDPKKRFANVQAVLDALERRRLRRAQLPLLVLGVGAPILLLIVITIFAYNGFSTALNHSEAAIIGRALESNRFAAQFVAENVAGQINHRWRLLEQAASNPGMQQMLAAAYGQPRGSPQREAMQAAISGLREMHPEVSATSWFITDRDGRQMARYPLDEKTIDQDYSFRDYFHGQGHDLKPGTKDVEPIRHVHRSNVFRSRATNHRMVAFSVPVFAESSNGDPRQVEGVLAMTAELGTFAELRPEYGSSAGQFAVLVDSHKDWQGRSGAVLEHPELARLMRGNFGKLPEIYLPPSEIDALAELHPLKLEVLQESERGHPQSQDSPVTDDADADSGRRFGADDALEMRKNESKSAPVSGTSSSADTPSNPIRLKDRDADVGAPSEKDRARSAKMRELAVRTHYIDPVGGEYQGRWLAAVEPVIVVDRPPAIGDTGWAVIVQERYADASQPVWDLAPQLKQMGLIALTVVGMLVMMLWGFVMVVLNDGPHSKALAGIRRKIGLSSLRGTSGRSTPNRSTEAGDQATVEYETVKKNSDG